MNTYVVILNNLDAEMEKEKNSYEDIKQNFFLLTFITFLASELDLCTNELKSYVKYVTMFK